MIEARDFAALRGVVREWAPADVAEVIVDRPEDEQVIVGRVLARDLAADDLEVAVSHAQPALVRALMQKTFIALNVTDSERDALNIFRKYDRTVLPVIDSTGVLLGIVTVDDMLDVAEQEATEEFQKFGGMEALEEPYMRIPLWRMVRKRAGCLIILFLGQMLTATAMANYLEELAKALVLALFLPLNVSSGGNSGSQASTLMIRPMALGAVTLADWWRVMGREVQAGLSLGVILGVIGVVRVAAWAIIGEQYFH